MLEGPARRALAVHLRLLAASGRTERASTIAYRARARRLARDAHGTIERWGVRFELDLNDNVQRTFYYTGWYERPFLELLEQELEPSDTYVDVGAHVGIDAAFVARLVPDGAVFAFEPAPDTAAILGATVGRLPNVHVVPVALGNAADTIRLRSNPKWHPADAATRSRFGSGDVVCESRMIRFDDWAADSALTRMDVVKIDAEGSELEALRGMARSLRRLRPRLVAVELHQPHLVAAGTSDTEIVDLLAGLGYEREQTLFENAIFRALPSGPQTG